MLKSSPKRWLKKALLRSSILQMAAHVAPASAVILAYHSIVEEPKETEQILGLSASRKTFEAHMRILAEQFSPVTVAEVAEFAENGRKLPPRAVAVTFDDGFADNFTVAVPVLARYGIPATFYIFVNAVAAGTLPWYCRVRFAFSTTRKKEWQLSGSNRTYSLESPANRKAALTAAWEACAGKTGDDQLAAVTQIERSLNVESVNGEHGFMMTWSQVQELRKAGHTVGAHTMSHPNVAHVSETEARFEIVESKKRLEQELGVPVEHFSYPHPALNPQWSRQTLEITREAGFKSAVLTTCGPIRRGDDPLALKRIYTAPDLDQFTWNLQSTFLGKSI
jgi:peptidoglycan/xylan/chitin deacetylase (PgdA/CDA1 family)